MAKSKAKSKEVEVEELPEEVEAEPEEVEADVEDVESVEDVEDVEAVGDLEDVEAVEDVEAAGGEEPPEGSVDEPPPAPPKPRLTKTAIILLFANWIMVPTFLYFAYSFHHIRSEYGYRAVLNYSQVWGLPLESEEEFPSFSNETRPKLRLTKEQIAAAVKQRPGAKAGGEFAPVEEPVPLRLHPSDMTEALMVDVFRDLKDPVPTLEKEIERLKTQLPKDIDAAADEVLKKQANDAEKKAFVQKTLLPMALDNRLDADAPKQPIVWDTWLVDKLAKRLNEATGAELDSLVKETAQRRMYYDILAPLNVFRPGDVNKNLIDRFADLDNVKLEEIKDLLQKRLTGSIAETYNADVHIGDAFEKNVKRDSAEKRLKIAFLMVALSQVEKPGLGEKLVRKGVERAQTVCGLHEFSNACINYVRAVGILEDRIAKAVVADRQGSTVKDGGGQTDGFISQYETQIDRNAIDAGQVEALTKRLDDLNKRKDQFQKIYTQRSQHRDATMDKLLKTRKQTEKYMNDLRREQDQLHQALIELSEAGARNLRLVEEITTIEMDFIRQNTPKGGKR